METIRSQQEVSRRRFLLGLFAASSAMTGCLSTGKLKSITPSLPTMPTLSSSKTVEESPVKQVVTTWNNKVVYAPDPTRGGSPTSGLMGRLYLFGADGGTPLMADGKIVVDLFDLSEETPRMLEQWNIDNETLGKLKKDDVFGMGYSIFLPWSTYKSNIQAINLILKYEPPVGKAIISQSGRLSVDHDETSKKNKESLKVKKTNS
jgi:hypothetical protein